MKTRLILPMIFLLFPILAASQGDPAFNGKWVVVPQASHDIALFATMSVEFRQQPSSVTLLQKWGTNRFFLDSLVLKLGGVVNTMAIHDRPWPSNVFMGRSHFRGERQAARPIAPGRSEPIRRGGGARPR